MSSEEDNAVQSVLERGWGVKNEVLVEWYQVKLKRASDGSIVSVPGCSSVGS